ncbi:hypothetical protein BS50DRAFT_582406 [Corynespora cassiicola Philippines]|uniref:Uncharacterized protein n=1 Tax=Corynespora cassiicola Philippines TaxID=1448308 RepID=A0A2T2P519_CORCC|nr:hypothetical protein BS50DRAFT_582406 [Corynespora cassiicola Philippines]
MDIVCILSHGSNQENTQVGSPSRPEPRQTGPRIHCPPTLRAWNSPRRSRIHSKSRTFSSLPQVPPSPAPQADITAPEQRSPDFSTPRHRPPPSVTTPPYEKPLVRVGNGNSSTRTHIQPVTATTTAIAAMLPDPKRWPNARGYIHGLAQHPS